MMLRKYQKAENSKVLSPDEHARLEKALHSLDKTSAKGLSDKEQKEFSKLLEK